MMKFLSLLLRHCANLYNVVKLSLNKLEQDQTGKIMLVIAKYYEIHLLHSMVKLVGLNWNELDRTGQKWVGIHFKT